MKCEDCRYWETGTCKRYPPVVVHGEVPRTDGKLGEKLGHAWKHPPTSASDWCGEFEERGERV